MKVKDVHVRLFNQGRESHAKRIEELRKQSNYMKRRSTPMKLVFHSARIDSAIF